MSMTVKTCKNISLFASIPGVGWVVPREQTFKGRLEGGIPDAVVEFLQTHEFSKFLTKKTEELRETLQKWTEF